MTAPSFNTKDLSQTNMNKTGFSLVEIIISVLIITIMSAGMLGAFVGGQQLINRSSHRLQAMNFAREAYDRLRANYKYTDPQMDVTIEPARHDESEIGTIVRGDMTSLGDPLKYAVASSDQTAYKEVTVYVTWTEPIWTEPVL